MIILDTNVLSEVIKPLAAEAVLRWSHSVDSDDLFVTAITQAEMLYGIAILPTGKRKNSLSEATERLFDIRFRNRILPFDSQSARIYADLTAVREAAGRPVSQFDCMIAAIAQAHGATLATRNTADFDLCGIHVVNPWHRKPSR